MKEKISKFMRGRYGTDELNICLVAAGVILFLLSHFGHIFYSLGLVALCYAIFRSLSGNIYARRAENDAIKPYFLFIKALLSDRGRHKLFLCPKCKRTLRIPKGRGHVTLTCPCGNQLKKKS